MKKIYLLIIGIVFSAAMLQSCKKGEGFLAATTTTNLSVTTVFSDSSRTAGFLANIYSNIGISASPSRFVFEPFGRNIIVGGLDAACDESEPSHSFSTDAQAFLTGTINPGTVSNEPYNTCYINIRAVNQLLKNIPSTPIKAANKAQMVAEARFLRAWYYAMLLKHYGGIPLVGDTLLNYNTPINVKRSAYGACVNYITSECDAAAQVLPLTQSGLSYGRASKGACLALKARVLLYAASPLFNGTTLVTDAGGSSGTVADASIVGYPTYNISRWQDAENAALAVISSGAYALNTVNNYQTSTPGYGFQGLFPQRVNTEYIFQLMRPTNNNDLENLFLPPSRSGNSGGAYPYQGLVDAFPMSNGKLITDPTSQYNPDDPYSNRDPRLNYSIIHDQTVLSLRTGNGLISGAAPVKIFIGNYNGVASDQDAVHTGTLTGYYCNKMLDPAALAASLIGTNRCLPLIRYAEILLDYAEAANEFEGPTINVYNAVQMIRQRAGLNPYTLPVGLSQAAMRTYIQNERRIELAFEEHRFWDVRRWKIAPQTENIQGMGLEIDRNGAATVIKPFGLTQHNFRAAMYLWPIPQSETGKSSTLAQNPGY